MLNRSPLKQEEGQALIQVTLSIMVLFAFVALAIDVGRVYAERRNMQNAADAAALAGARELCLGRSTTAAEAKAAEIMQANGVAAAAIGVDDITFEGSPDPNIINVVARHPDLSPVVGQLVAWDVVDVAAIASAACGAATTGCGLWPVAFSKDIWNEMYGEDGEITEERNIAIWNDDNGNQSNKKVCTTPDGEISTNMCDCYACPDNSPDDGVDDYVFVSIDGRAWLDFSSAVEPYADTCASGGYGAAELKCQLARDSAAQISLPQCIPGDAGNKAGVASTINARAGDILRIPLYDDMACDAGGFGGGASYNISTVGCIQVVEWDKLKRDDTSDPNKLEQQGIFPVGTYPDINANSERVIWAKALPNIACMTACGSTDGSQPIPGQLTAVSLIE